MCLWMRKAITLQVVQFILVRRSCSRFSWIKLNYAV